MILRYEISRLQQQKNEQSVFPTVPQFPVPMLPHHYEELPQHHREQIIWTYLPHIQSQHNGDFSHIFTLNIRERMKAYEKMIFLGYDLKSAIELANLNLHEGTPRRNARFSHKDIKKVISYIEENPGVRAEDLIDCIPPRLFSRLMLFTKFSGNNQGSLLRFFRNLTKK